MLRKFSIANMKKYLLFLCGLLLLVAVAWLPWQSHKVDYNIVVKPILNKHCMSCHGGVKKKGGFSLLTREEALQPTESGKIAIVPGKPGESELIRRISSHDQEERMPYRKDPLQPEEISILKQWIEDGAPWELNWAYRPVENPAIPTNHRPWWDFFSKKQEDHWSINNVDRFVWNKLQQEKIQPQPAAAKEDILQRVSMDLTGLPPSTIISQQFLNDTSAFAYERLVDSLLASPRYGERWASMWLDLARYADSKGYERDAGRYIWHYRDWVIRAFNADMPYDQFLTEQLAGDLLPDPTDDQYIATAFHRNTMTNDEGGTDNEEFRTAAVIDRVNTTWEAVMGTTFACVQCHSHPYDPFQHEEYYQFFGFFNQTRDNDTWEEYPVLRHFAGKDSLKALAFQGWVKQNETPEEAARILQFVKNIQPSLYSINADSFLNCELYDTKWLTMRNHARCRLKKVDLTGISQLIFRYTARTKTGQWTVRLDSTTGPILFSTKIDTSGMGRKMIAIDFPEQIGIHNLFFKYENAQLKKNEDADLQFDIFHFTKPYLTGDKPGFADARKQFWELVRTPTWETPILLDGPPSFHRETHVFERGNWLVPGKTVSPGTPKILPPMPAGAPLNRFGMAQWLTNKNHPLTSRTIVNRLWEQLFGYGLAETLEDLGSQGIPPTQPQLLDHLAWNLMNEDNWSIKKILREMVLSATYRQDNRCAPNLLERDPQNRLLARGPRIRLSAEQLRDKALAVCGVLSSKMYGAGVMPYQPAGTWKTPWNGSDWKMSEGEDRYRRAVYTYWKRSSGYPSALLFDASQRAVCTARRVRTNTPLQALVTMNDSTFVDMACILAKKITAEQSGDIRQKISRMFERAIGHVPTPEKIQPLIDLYDKAAVLFRKDPLQTEKFMGEKTAQPEDAALAVVANAVLNLDEFVMK